jgi:hypothetical protein
LIVFGLFRDAEFVQLGIDFGRGHCVPFTPPRSGTELIVNQRRYVSALRCQVSGKSVDLDLAVFPDTWCLVPGTWFILSSS